MGVVLGLYWGYYFSDGSSDDTTTPKLGFLIKVPMLPSLLQNEACPLRLIVTFGRQILSPCNEMTQAAVEGQTPALLHDPIYPYHRILGSLAGVCPSTVQDLLVLCREEVIFQYIYIYHNKL